ncbi:MAG: methyltransferase [Alphaproteobacteria bacterium]|nr:methyltransferase [Alphaproteobacteria bacterium]
MTTYRIEKIDKDFDGLVFNQQNQAIKVPFTLPSETVNINKIDASNKVGVAVDFNILEYSHNRTAPVCPYFTKCGGCKAQHFPESMYLEQKIANLVHLLEVNNISYPKPIEIIHHYGDAGHRRRIILSCNGKQLGFKAYRSNTIIDINLCSIATENINKIIPILRNVVEKFNHKLKIVEIIISDVNGNIDVDINAKIKINRDVIEAMQEAFTYPLIKKITWANELLITKDEISLTYGKYQIPFVSGGFLQPEKFGEDVLINFVLNNLKNSAKILDLFCGFGGYTFSLLSKANAEKIYAVDVSAGAVKAMQKYASPKMQAEIRNLFKNPLSADFINNFDSVILNPPRDGALAQVREIAKSNIKKAAMVYCSASSIVRDLMILKNGLDLQIQEIKVLDQFIYSPHLEIMIYFAKK